MDNSTIAFVTRNCSERFFYEVLAHVAERMQFLHEVPFRLCLTVREGLFFEPFEETRESCCILPHGDAFPL